MNEMTPLSIKDLDLLERIGLRLRFLDEDHNMGDVGDIVYNDGKDISEIVERVRLERRRQLALRADDI